MVQAGQVTVVESRSLSLTIEELLDDLISAIERTGATRVVIDSLSELGLFLAPEFRADVRLAVFRTLAALAKRGVSAVVTMGIEDSLSQARFSPDAIAFLTDAVVALRYAEVDSCLRQFMLVVKVRGIDHSRELREFHITDKGLEVDDHAANLDRVLSGWPTPRMPNH
jgi:circadian clock protein KaiC